MGECVECEWLLWRVVWCVGHHRVLLQLQLVPLRDGSDVALVVSEDILKERREVDLTVVECVA